MLETDFVDWLPKLSYIKVDAEGYDRAILESIRPIIRGRRPVIRTEVYRKLLARERHELFDLLAKAGYCVHRFEDDTCPLGEILERSDMTREKHFERARHSAIAPGVSAAFSTFRLEVFTVQNSPPGF